MADFSLPETWDRVGLEAVGFRGFVPLQKLDTASLPPRRGIYAILRPSTTSPEFIAENPIVKRRIYSIDDLIAKWVQGTSIVYIGKADPVDGIFGRLGVFSRRSSSHSGGRAIWQLSDAAELLAAWVETPEHVAETVEKLYLGAFRDAHGRLPFANWRL